MESLPIVWQLLLMLSVFVFPQWLGILLYHRLGWLPKWVARGVCVIATAVAFFFLSPIFFFAGLREAELKGELNCGMPVMAATLVVLIGTGFSLFVAAVIHLGLFFRNRAT